MLPVVRFDFTETRVTVACLVAFGITHIEFWLGCDPVWPLLRAVIFCLPAGTACFYVNRWNEGIYSTTHG